MARRDCYLLVAGWRNQRHAVIEGNTLMMEVALAACQHCPICSQRIRTVETRLRETNAKWRWESAGNGLYLAIELPAETVQVGDYLTRLLGVSIRVTG